MSDAELYDVILLDLTKFQYVLGSGYVYEIRNYLVKSIERSKCHELLSKAVPEVNNRPYYEEGGCLRVKTQFIF